MSERLKTDAQHKKSCSIRGSFSVISYARADNCGGTFRRTGCHEFDEVSGKSKNVRHGFVRLAISEFCRLRLKPGRFIRE